MKSHSKKTDLILIAEDSAYMRYYLTDILSEQYCVQTAVDGQEAFEVAMREHPALILSDIIMPRSDGFELLKMVRSHRKIAHTPFILITSRTDKASIVEGLEAGADDYLKKPICLPELLARVKTHLELHHLRRKELENALKTEKKNNKQKDKFIEIASHELKTPLTCLNGYIQLLDDPDLENNELRQFYIKKSRDQLKTLSGLVNELTNITKIQSGYDVSNFTQVDMLKFVDEIINKLQNNYAHHKIILEGSQGLIIRADKTRMEQVLVNYISNAVKFSPDSDRVDVVVRDNGNGHAEVAVKDSGIGIPEEKMENLFQRFYRVDPIKVSGFGLGLYTSSEILKQHGGKAWAESTYGAGSKFCFKVPLVKKPKSL